MSNNNTVSIKLTVNDDGSVTMKQFGKNTEEAMKKSEESTKKASMSFQSLKGSYLEFSAKAASAYLAITKAMEYMDQGAKAAQAEASFRTLAAASGESADAIIANMKRATNSTIDDSDMMQKAAKAMLLEFSGDQITKMAEAARLAARSTGEDVGQAFENIANAISTNMPKALKQYGLITKEQMAMINQAMAEGVEGIDLYSLAISNLAVQQAKMGPLLDNDAEKLQQYKAAINDAKETFGQFLTVVTGESLDLAPALGAVFFGGGNLAPLEAYIKKLMEVDEVTKAVSETNKAAAEEDRRNVENKIKASQALVAQKKAELETTKALNKDYFASQEANLKTMLELVKAAGGDEYKATTDMLKKREELNAEYYTRTKAEIELEAAARSKADRDKISDAAYTAQKIQALDAQTAAMSRQLYQQKTMESIQAAQDDISSLQSRLSEYQQYYESLKAKMDKNIEDERKHLEELKTLRQQSVDVDKSTAALIAGIKGTDKSLSQQDQYEASRSALNSQFGSALDLSGQDRVKALEEYKQAVAALQAQYAQGIPGGKDIFGDTQQIISAKTIMEDAISDIERAAQMQKNALAELTAEKQVQIEADRQWGQVLQSEAQRVQGEMQNLQNIIADISAEIQSMQKTIELTGVDHVTSVVDSIINRIEQLHALARQPVNINAVMPSSNSGFISGISNNYSSSYTNGGLNLNADLNLEPLMLGSFATGTPYVPKTGPYKLHQGEAVIPATENRSGKSVNINGDIIINVPDSAAANRPEDWRMITRQYIVPELRKLQ